MFVLTTTVLFILFFTFDIKDLFLLAWFYYYKSSQKNYLWNIGRIKTILVCKFTILNIEEWNHWFWLYLPNFADILVSSNCPFPTRSDTEELARLLVVRQLGLPYLCWLPGRWPGGFLIKIKTNSAQHSWAEDWQLIMLMEVLNYSSIEKISRDIFLYLASKKFRSLHLLERKYVPNPHKGRHH